MQTKYPFNIFCDVETTGFDPWRNDICSLAVIVTNNNLSVESSFYTTVKPEINKFYSEDAESVHGFTRDEMKTFPPPECVCNDLLAFLAPFKAKNNSPRLFVSHSLRQFDYLFLEVMFRKQGLEYELWKVIEQRHQRSTIKEARKQGYKKNGLAEWSKRLGFDLKHHDALSDTMGCLEVDRYLRRNYGTLANGTSDF